MKMRNCMHSAMAAILTAGMLLAVDSRALAQDILEFTNGYLTFTNVSPALYYRIEYKPNLTEFEAWDGTYQRLKNIQTNAHTVTVPVGVFYRVVGSSEPVGIGTAEPGDILAPKTMFVNGVEVTGTMPNIGQQNVTPGALAQTILQGYHDGRGQVSGDSNLKAGNIKKDVKIFGVTGTYDQTAVTKTGQTTSYRTGDDGTYQKGVVWPNPRFTDHGNGTVTDNLTGLMWVKSPHLLNGNSGLKAWTSAIDFCNNLSLEGHFDWRLPNIRELKSLIDYGRFNPPLPSGHPFTDVKMDAYWSSSTRADATSEAWYVILYAGNVTSWFKSETAYAWPVRAGQ